MFLYRLRRLKSEVNAGILVSQFQMVRLYTMNLGSLGGQAGFIASLSYLGVQNALICPVIKTSNLALCYNSLYAISISSALIILSHCLLASLLGPTKALIGTLVTIASLVFDFR
jgi:hypothetical protein